MRKPWIIPLLILIFLITAGIFRWDNGPSQSFGGSLKIQYLTDRWTGQPWLKLYGSLPGRPLSSKSEQWVNIISVTTINPFSDQACTGGLYPGISTNKINKLLSEESFHTDDSAKRALSRKANYTKNLITKIWIVLIAISSIMTLVLYLKPKRSNTMLNKSA